MFATKSGKPVLRSTPHNARRTVHASFRPTRVYCAVHRARSAVRGTPYTHLAPRCEARCTRAFCPFTNPLLSVQGTGCSLWLSPTEAWRTLTAMRHFWG